MTVGTFTVSYTQQGAILDEEHLVALLHACFVERDSDAAWNLAAMA